MKQQLSLFEQSNKPKHEHKQHRKYDYTHWSFEQRVRHLVASSNWISWKGVYLMIKNRIINDVTITGASHHTRLPEAVSELRIQKNSQHPQFQSINKLAKFYNVSKPTLYRAYYRKYGK